MIITALQRRPRTRRVEVFVDGEPVVTLHADLAAERELRPGRPTSRSELAALEREDARRGALQAAMRLLSYRPRSEREVRGRLARRGFRGDAISTAVARLRELGYLDDGAFARFYAETQQSARPRSKRLLAAELRRRGVGQEAAEEATSEVSDEEAALEAARRRLRVVRGLEYQAFRERLGRFLTQRGFSYEVSLATVRRCWEEVASDGDGGAR